jgi:hypothetical protein
LLARALLRHWRPDPKRDKRIARYREAGTIDKQIAELLADESLTRAQAMERVRGRHNSSHALDKFLRRNRRPPRE